MKGVFLLSKKILILQKSPKDKFMIDIFAYPYNARFLGNGLLTELNFDKWKHRRAIFNQGFHRT
jgi:hypothetical protein